MALVTLGTRELITGKLPVEFDPFAFKKDKAYIIRGELSIEKPTLVYSRLRIRPVFTTVNFSRYYTHHTIELPITERPFIFLLPFSKVYGDDGTVYFEAERLSNLYSTADRAGRVTLRLRWDDKEDDKTWL